MGLLPWERLPAYVFGPLLIALDLWLAIAADDLSVWHWVLAAGCVAFGTWIVWARWRTGQEPLWTEAQRAAARKRRARID